MMIRISNFEIVILISSCRAQVLFSNGTYAERDSLLAQVKNIRVNGSTNLEVGLKVGSSVFPTYSHDVKKMFLFRYIEFVPFLNRICHNFFFTEKYFYPRKKCFHCGEKKFRQIHIKKNFYPIKNRPPKIFTNKNCDKFTLNFFTPKIYIIPLQIFFSSIFSDGVANVGVTSKDGIFSIVDGIYQQGVGVSSFGIGADFDETMMKGIGEHGHGTFFFIGKTAPQYFCPLKKMFPMGGKIRTNSP